MKILERNLTGSRRASAGCLVFLAAFSAAAAASGCRGRDAGREDVLPGPDLVVVSIDTLRADCLQGDGPRRARTPTLDALARDGLALENAHAHVPLTLPSHATLLTGLLPPALELHDNAPFPLRGDVPTLASWLAAHGFATDAVIGGAPLARARQRHRARLRALRRPAPRRRRRDPLRRAHRRRRDRPRARRLVARRRRPAPTALRPLLRSAPALRPPRPPLPPSLPSPPSLPPSLPPPPPPPPPPADGHEPADATARYLGEVAYVDHELARLVAALRTGGRRCLLFVTSDHGEGLGDHGERTHGYQLFESTLHVPMVLAEIDGERTSPSPGLREVDRARLVRMVDLLPTLLRELGVDAPAGLAGVALQEAAPADVTCYVESLASSLQFGWAQMTGVRGDDATLLRGGAGAPDAIPGLGAIVAGSDDERLLVDERATPPDAARWSGWREALVAARTSPLPPADDAASLTAIPALGYVAGAADRARQALRPFAENARLPSPLARQEAIDALLVAVERLEGGDARGAEAELTRLLAGDPGNRAALCFRARARLELAKGAGDGRAARSAAADLAALLELEPSYPGAALLRAKALGLAGDFDAAFAAIAQLEPAGESAPLEHLLGSLLLAPIAAGRTNPRYDPEQGYGHLLRSLELDPSQAALARDVGDRLRRLARGAAAPPWTAAALARLARIERS